MAQQIFWSVMENITRPLGVGGETERYKEEYLLKSHLPLGRCPKGRTDEVDEWGQEFGNLFHLIEIHLLAVTQGLVVIHLWPLQRHQEEILLHDWAVSFWMNKYNLASMHTFPPPKCLKKKCWSSTTVFYIHNSRILNSACKHLNTLKSEANIQTERWIWI